jgi:hypothetical protein
VLVLTLLAAFAVYQQRIGVAIAIGLLISFAIALGAEGTATATRLVLAAVEELDQSANESDAAHPARFERPARGRIRSLLRGRPSRSLAGSLGDGKERR